MLTQAQDGDDPRYAKLIATSKHFMGYHLESWDGVCHTVIAHGNVAATGSVTHEWWRRGQAVPSVALGERRLRARVCCTRARDRYACTQFNYSDTDIAQYYLLPFEAAVNAGVAAVMCAYDGQNGTNG